MHEESAGGFGDVIGGGVAEDDEFSEQREAEFGQIVVFRGEEGNDGDAFLLEVVGNGDPVVAGHFPGQLALGRAFVLVMTVALVVMRTRVRVVDDHGLTHVAFGPDALASQTNGLVKAGFHRLGRVPIPRRPQILHETVE